MLNRFGNVPHLNVANSPDIRKDMAFKQ